MSCPAARAVEMLGRRSKQPRTRPRSGQLGIRAETRKRKLDRRNRYFNSGKMKAYLRQALGNPAIVLESEERTFLNDSSLRWPQRATELELAHKVTRTDLTTLRL